MTSTETKDCQVLIRQLKAKHKQIALQWIPGHSQIAGNEYADTLAKKGAKITQTHVRETSYHSIKLHLKQVFRNAYRQELGTKLSQKPWTQELAKIPDCPRRRAVAEFRLYKSTSLAKTVGKEFSNYEATKGLVNETQFTLGQCRVTERNLWKTLHL